MQLIHLAVQKEGNALVSVLAHMLLDWQYIQVKNHTGQNQRITTQINITLILQNL
jgi:hypothetical protein